MFPLGLSQKSKGGSRVSSFPPEFYPGEIKSFKKKELETGSSNFLTCDIFIRSPNFKKFSAGHFSRVKISAASFLWETNQALKNKC